jgi:hypothetical protein
VYTGGTYTFNDATNITGVTINYLDVVSGTYNDVTVTRTPYAPKAPQFIGNLPVIYPVSVLYEGSAIQSHTSEIHFDLAAYPEIKQPAMTSVYHRLFPDNGLFLPIQTDYDSLNNELITTISRFGELVFGTPGQPYAANPPIPYEPEDKIRVLPLDSLALRWTGQGMTDGFRVQLSTDSLFNTTLVDSILISSFIYIDQILNHTSYFWRVRSLLNGAESEWSSVWRFETTDPFIILNSPNGGEEWIVGSTEVVRWETNISDSVEIDLLLAQQYDRPIGSVPGNHGAFSWDVPMDLPISSDYTMRIRSILDTTLLSVSNQSFSILDTSASGIDDNPKNTPAEFALYPNYPNPFNPETTISFAVPQHSRVVLKIVDMRGSLVATLVDREFEPGQHKIKFSAEGLASGIYLTVMQNGDFTQIRKIMFLK